MYHNLLVDEKRKRCEGEGQIKKEKSEIIEQRKGI